MLDRPSIALRASPEPADLGLSSARSTRRDRSPAVIASAVFPIASSGLRPSRTIQSPSATIAGEDDRGDEELDQEQPVQRAVDVRARTR